MTSQPTRIKRGSRIADARTRIAAIIVLAACGLFGVLAPVASALPGSSVDNYYYSNAAKTKLVGQSHLSCQGVFRKTGKITPYYDSYDAPCN
jgi:Family of unknown function (DUF6289)